MCLVALAEINVPLHFIPCRHIRDSGDPIHFLEQNGKRRSLETDDSGSLRDKHTLECLQKRFRILDVQSMHSTTDDESQAAKTAVAMKELSKQARPIDSFGLKAGDVYMFLGDFIHADPPRSTWCSFSE